MLSTVRKFLRNSKGATAIEYGLIAALISVGAIVAFTNFGTGLSNMWNGVANEMSSS